MNNTRNDKYDEFKQHIERATLSVAHFLKDFLPLANIHNCRLITDAIWEKHVPPKLASQLDSLTDKELDELLIPDPNLVPKHVSHTCDNCIDSCLKLSHGSVAEDSNWRPSWDQSLVSNWKYDDLNEFLHLAQSHTLPYLGVLSSLQDVFQSLPNDVQKDKGLCSINHTLKEKKQHEVPLMVDACSGLAQGAGLSHIQLCVLLPTLDRFDILQGSYTSWKLLETPGNGQIHFQALETPGNGPEPPGNSWKLKVVIEPLNECIQQDDDNKPVFCKLRHPRSDAAAMFLFCDNDRKLYEVTKFQEEFRSWFIGNTIQQDGSLFMTMPVNPVFLLLHYLIKEAKDDKFKPLDQIVKDEDYPECHRLCQCVDTDMLNNFADEKGPDDFKVYKFNTDKALSWLKLKVEEISERLKAKNFNVRGGSQAATYVKNDTKPEDYVRYAHGILSEYLPITLSQDLKSHMGIKDPVVLHEKPDIEQPNAKRHKKNAEPTDDYSKGAGDILKSAEPKLTRAQKTLSKVDKKGMKSIASFFSPKAAKK